MLVKRIMESFHVKIDTLVVFSNLHIYIILKNEILLLKRRGRDGWDPTGRPRPTSASIYSYLVVIIRRKCQFVETRGVIRVG